MENTKSKQPLRDQTLLVVSSVLDSSTQEFLLFNYTNNIKQIVFFFFFFIFW